MASQRQKGRLPSSIRRLLCSSVKDGKDYYEEERGGARGGPLAFATDDVSTYFPNPPFEEVYNGRIIDLDDSVYASSVDGNDEPPPLKRPTNASAKESRRRTTSTLKKHTSSTSSKESARPKPPARTKSGSSVVPKRWHEDGGEDQPSRPTQTPPRKSSTSVSGGSRRSLQESLRYRQADDSTGSSVRLRRTISPLSVAEDSFGFDISRSSSNGSLIKRVEMVKAKAEAILMEAQKKKSREMNGAMSVKSVASSILTEPTLGASFSASSRSNDTFSDKMKRLQKTRSRLQRFSDEHSQTSTIHSDTVNHSFSFNKANESSLLEESSSDEDSVPEVLKGNGDGGDVLRMLNMLEQINGYDLSVFENTLDETAILDLDLSFLKNPTASG